MINPVNKFMEHLISHGIFPFEKVIADGDPHQFIDARNGRQFTYVIYEKKFRLIEIATKAA